MRFFKYLVFVLLTLFSASAYSAVKYRMQNSDPSELYSSKEAACSNWKHTWVGNPDVATKVDGDYCRAYRVKDNGAMGHALILKVTAACPSAQEIALKVSVNAQKYQCVNGCQYGLTKCVDIDFEPGMTCDAISTGIDCGGAPPTTPPKPDDPKQPDSGAGPAAPGQGDNNNSSNTNTSTSNSTSTSTSTSTNTSTNETTNTTTTTNTTNTTTLDLSGLEATLTRLFSNLGTRIDNAADAIKEAINGIENGSNDGTDLTATNQKLDDIKKNGEKTNNWLQGKNEDGTGGGVGDNPFGTDVTPERVLDAKSFKTDIFQSNAQCPADKTLSMTLFTGRTFSRTLSFSMWCDKLAIFGSLILIAAYLYGASIIVRNS
ncbi:virulence factor TspB C-terminal domain-related protein [Acinetobacter bohemicus]|uniref:virulence factor TspB C-terminal domain-related protein n=1 Tax=Acinetobacter bohemicus TaxID=1435036 RepID=UPI0040428E86